MASSVDIPVMLYNLPVATGVDLHPDAVGGWAREVENIRYIKNTTTDMAQSAQLIHNYGDVIATFVGWDSLLLSALAEGAAGVMAGTASLQWPSVQSRRPDPRLHEDGLRAGSVARRSPH
jgi:4-hydroxy-tetrahydrodipicolinate synthase